MVWLEALSYIVTILGFPVAIGVILYEERKRRANEENELHRNLSQEYDSFLRMVMDNSDLLLLSRASPPEPLTPEQRERSEIIFRMLISLFEKAYIILYQDNLSGDAQRRWMSWEDDMAEWCKRQDFRSTLPMLLEGEDDAFSAHILAIADEAARRTQ
jgi:hypothetical protein